MEAKDVVNAIQMLPSAHFENALLQELRNSGMLKNYKQKKRRTAQEIIFKANFRAVLSTGYAIVNPDVKADLIVVNPKTLESWRKKDGITS